MSNFNSSPLTDDEDKALASYEDDLERMINENISHGQDLSSQKLFLAFQNAAKEVTKMFRERSNGTANWNTFHAAAEAVTVLYKESLDTLKDAIQLGMVNGEHRKTKDVLCWTRRKQRRHLRIDEIYQHLVGHSLLSSSLLSDPNDSISGASSINQSSTQPIVEDLQTFRQALVMNGNSSVDPSSSNPSQTSEQLDNFVCQQMANQLAGKRSFCATTDSTNSNESQKVKRTRHM